MREVRPHDVSPSGPIEDSLLGRRRVVGLFFSLARCRRFFSAGGSGILISDVRLDVHITSFAVARPQKADGAGTGQLRGRPEPFTGKGATSLVVNQTDQVQFVRHCSKLPPDGLPGQKESTVVHERNCAIEATSRTMDSQRTADSVLKRLNRLSHPRGQAHHVAFTVKECSGRS
jgi:hypothetical protein